MNAIGIDIGSSNIRIAYTGEYGAVIETEPAIVAVDSMKKPIACGLAAEMLAKRSPGAGTVISPFASAQLPEKEYVQAFADRIIKGGHFRGYDVFFSYPGERNDELERLYVGAIQKAGARNAYAVDACYAAALGCGISGISESVIVNIGDKTTDIVSFIHSKPTASFHCGYAGNSFSRAVAAYIFKKTHCRVERKEADRIKEEGGYIGNIPAKEISFPAMKASFGLPEILTVTAKEVSGALEPIFDELADEIISAVRGLPSEPDKVVLTGGGAKLSGLADSLSPLICIQICVADKPEEAVIRGLYNLAERTNKKASKK